MARTAWFSWGLLRLEENNTEDVVLRVCDKLDITHQLAKELLILANGDESLVVECSRSAINVPECKALIIDKRLKRIEDRVQKGARDSEQ